MRDKLSNWRRIWTPPGWVIALLWLICAPALGLVFASGWTEDPRGLRAVVVYGVYVLSAYALAVLTVALLRVHPRRRVRAWLASYPTGRRYLTDPRFRTRVSLSVSLGMNLLYVAVHLITGLHLRAAWYLCLAGYYLILAGTRLLLLRHRAGQSPAAEYRRARLCVGILLLTNLSLTGVVLMILRQGRGFAYPGVWIYAMAAYTFYLTITAVRNLITYRRYHSPVLSAARTVNLAAALVSMLALETALLAQFGEDPVFRGRMVAATGAGISAVVVSLSVCQIVHHTRQLRSEFHGI